jgi:hypothetical protein
LTGRVLQQKLTRKIGLFVVTAFEKRDHAPVYEFSNRTARRYRLASNKKVWHVVIHTIAQSSEMQVSAPGAVLLEVGGISRSERSELERRRTARRRGLDIGKVGL